LKDLIKKYKNNVITNAQEILDSNDQNMVIVVKDDIEQKLKYILWDSAQNAFTSAGIKFLGTNWIYEESIGVSWAESAKVWGLIYNSGMIFIDLRNNMVSVRDAEADIRSSTVLSDEQKAYALEQVNRLKWGYGALTMLRMVGASLDFGISASYGPLAGTLANTVINIIADLAENYLDKSLAFYVAGGQGTYLKWVIDPSGYVFDAQTGKRLMNVIVSAYWFPNEEENPSYWDQIPDNQAQGELWDAKEYRQTNPMGTDEEGAYAWDVPEGWWRVKFEKEGYQTTWSEWLPVPPPQTEVNIGLIPDTSSN